MKIVLIGAGSAQFGYGMLGDIFQSKHLHDATIVLVDINAEALDTVYREAQDFLQKHSLKQRVIATTDQVEALKNADFVIISIEVGNRFTLWEEDWKIPHQFGITQIYGENGGPGGVFHALRVTPVILGICDDIMKLCPDAFVFCFSNPMTAICTTVTRKYPQLKFIGLCHEIASLKRDLPHILDTSIDDIEYRAAGLNHFSVLLQAKYKSTGKDAYPDIREKAPAYFEQLAGYSALWKYTQETNHVPETEGAESWEVKLQPLRQWSDRGVFRKIFEHFDLLPITIDSHLGEYISWAHEAADHQGIIDFFDFYRYALSGQQWAKIDFALSERVVPIIEGIMTDSGYEEPAVNIPNDGYIPSLPPEL